MAVPHIPINRSVRLGSKLGNHHDRFGEAISGLREDRDAMNVMIDTAPDPDDYSYLETQWGLPSGKGYDAWYQLDSIISAFDSNASQSALKDKLTQFLTYLA